MKYIEQYKQLKKDNFCKNSIIIALLILAILFLLLAKVCNGFLQNTFLNIFGGLTTGLLISAWSLINEHFKSKIQEKRLCLKKDIANTTIPIYELELNKIPSSYIPNYEKDLFSKEELKIFDCEYYTNKILDFVSMRCDYESACQQVLLLFDDVSLQNKINQFEISIIDMYNKLNNYHVDTYWYVPSSVISSMQNSTDSEQAYSPKSAEILFDNNDNVVLDDTYVKIIMHIEDFLDKAYELSEYLEKVKKCKIEKIESFYISK